jgi:hypothetical protein
MDPLTPIFFFEIVPAWAALFLGRGSPTRAPIAWLLLRERRGQRISRRDFPRLLAHELHVTLPTARQIVRSGATAGFWRREGRAWRIAEEGELWPRLARLSRWSRHEGLPVPRDVLLGPLARLRAYLARPAMTAGPERGLAVATSAHLLGSSQRTVRSWRRILRAEGLLATEPVYARVGAVRMDLADLSCPMRGVGSSAATRASTVASQTSACLRDPTEVSSTCSRPTTSSRGPSAESSCAATSQAGDNYRSGSLAVAR